MGFDIISVFRHSRAVLKLFRLPAVFFIFVSVLISFVCCFLSFESQYSRDGCIYRRIGTGTGG
jgi:hypothetical protein